MCTAIGKSFAICLLLTFDGEEKKFSIFYRSFVPHTARIDFQVPMPRDDFDLEETAKQRNLANEASLNAQQQHTTQHNQFE